jgi:putative DNA-invertase from lambdoid prophage Rac
LGQAAALYCRVSTADQTCARQERDLRAFAKKAGYKVVGVWKETASGAKLERAERKKVLALAQARKVDVILVTELTRWGRSARFAVRSLTCFKFRFVSSPHSGRRCVSNAVKRHGSLYAIL